jgi:hypothetical protein
MPNITLRRLLGFQRKMTAQPEMNMLTNDMRNSCRAHSACSSAHTFQPDVCGHKCIYPTNSVSLNITILPLFEKQKHFYNRHNVPKSATHILVSDRSDEAFCIFWPLNQQSARNMRCLLLHSRCLHKKNSGALVRQQTITTDRRLSAKLVPTLADRGCRVVSAKNPHGR